MAEITFKDITCDMCKTIARMSPPVRQSYQPWSSNSTPSQYEHTPPAGWGKYRSLDICPDCQNGLVPMRTIIELEPQAGPPQGGPFSNGHKDTGLERVTLAGARLAGSSWVLGFMRADGSYMEITGCPGVFLISPPPPPPQSLAIEGPLPQEETPQAPGWATPPGQQQARTSGTPIQTEYQGHRFRSRTEARTAVFLNAAGIRWVYEMEGYVLSSGERYLPDFWLPDFGLWIEVKGSEPDADMKAKLSLASLELPGVNGFSLAVIGPLPQPASSAYPGNYWWRIAGDMTGVAFTTGADGKGGIIRDTMSFPGSWLIPATSGLMEPHIAEAYRAARAARFEFGESG